MLPNMSKKESFNAEDAKYFQDEDNCPEDCCSSLIFTIRERPREEIMKELMAFNIKKFAMVESEPFCFSNENILTPIISVDAFDCCLDCGHLDKKHKIAEGELDYSGGDGDGDCECGQ